MSDEQLFKNRHSLSHIMTMAVLELYPDAGLGVGPVIDNGFYQDYDLPEPISDELLPKLQKRMREIIKKKIAFEQYAVDFDKALNDYKDDPYKTELIKDLKEAGERDVSFYKSDWFENLCKGPHVGTTEEIPVDSFKLTSVAGAYWRGDENNKMLTRIYGVAFPTKTELKEHLAMMEEAKKRDHRKLGKELQLFSIVPEIGSGLPLFYPRGATLRDQVESFIMDLQQRRGYEAIWVPHITKGKLYEISGHLDKYDAMFPPMHMDNEDYYLKPMNCPHFMMLYKTRAHSYRDLAVRWVCTTSVYRYEKSGELSGLTRVRSITQDDCHVFARPDQIEGEINEMLDMLQDVYRAFGFEDFWVSISTHEASNKEKYIGDPKVWSDSEAALEKLIGSRGWKYEVVPGEAAFYGPKLDFMFRDAIGREWQLSTIQLDMNLPERFELEYIDKENKPQRPVVIHRALLGSTERFLGILIEHYAGAFPLWLAPVQVRVASVGEAHHEAVQTFVNELNDAGVRAEADISDATVGAKIRNASKMKIPYTIIFGDKELDGSSLKIRVFGEEQEIAVEREDLIGHIETVVREQKGT